MNQTQTKSLIQLVGLAFVGFGLYQVWAVVATAAGFAGMIGGPQFQGLYLEVLKSMLPYLWPALLSEPWIWIGMVLIVAPYLIGLGGRHAEVPTAPTAPRIPSALYVNCSSCGEAVLETASFCPHCGSAR
mgnify:CR=1 FL=1